MTDTAVAERVLTEPERLQYARETLLNRAMGRAKRGRRAKRGSNERGVMVRQARLYSACVAEIDRDKTLRDSIVADGWDAGWRALSNRIVAYVRERDKDKLDG